MKTDNEGSALTCYLCGSQKYTVCPGKVRDNNTLEVRRCEQCGLVFLSSSDHISDDFYEQSGMHDHGDVDMESWLKESAWDDCRRFNSLQRLIENKSVLDVGCGNGGFLYLAKSAALSVAGVELERTAREFVASRRIPVSRSLGELSECYDVITLFHVLEHIKDPRNFISQLARRLTDQGQIIIEVPNADDALLSLYHNDPFANFTYWSCHLHLYSQATLSLLAKQSGLKVNYIKQVQRYPLSNHLYWLANGRPGGHKQWSCLDSPELHAAYEKQLAAIGVCDTLVASLSK